MQVENQSLMSLLQNVMNCTPSFFFKILMQNDANCSSFKHVSTKISNIWQILGQHGSQRARLPTSAHDNEYLEISGTNERPTLMSFAAAGCPLISSQCYNYKYHGSSPIHCHDHQQTSLSYRMPCKWQQGNGTFFTGLRVSIYHLFFKCCMLPMHLNAPFTMIAMRLHSASHSSMLCHTTAQVIK